MTLDDKITFFRIAANIADIGINDYHADVLIHAYESLLEKKGDCSLRDMARIKTDAKNRADAKNRSSLLDKVSEKI
jgi:hypothetical protein